MTTTFPRRRARHAVAALSIAAALAVAGPAVAASAYPAVPVTLVCSTVGAGTQVVVDGVATRLDTYCRSTAWVTTVAAEHGRATIDSYGWVTYTSDAGYRGSDTLTVTAVLRRDGTGLTSSFGIEVAAPATAGDDAFKVAAGGILHSTVLENDTMTGEWTVETGVTPPAHGTLELDPATGEFTYTPEPSFTGTDGFVYRLNNHDRAHSNIARVTITVG